MQKIKATAKLMSDLSPKHKTIEISFKSSEAVILLVTL